MQTCASPKPIFLTSKSNSISIITRSSLILTCLHPKRLILTHMSADMLARLGTLTCEYAEDGKVIEL